MAPAIGKRELEEQLKQKQKEISEIQAALQVESEQDRETAEKTKMKYIELMTVPTLDNDPSQTQLYLPHEIPALLPSLHDAIEVLNDRMEYYQAMNELVKEMAPRHPDKIPFHLIDEMEISSLVHLAECLKWDEGAASKLKKSVVPDMRLIKTLRDKVARKT